MQDRSKEHHPTPVEVCRRQKVPLESLTVAIAFHVCLMSISINFSSPANYMLSAFEGDMKRNVTLHINPT